MSESTFRLPARPSLEQLRRRAKERLSVLRATDSSAKLADAQFAIATDYGFASWPKVVHHVSVLDAQASEPRIIAPVSRRLGADAAIRRRGGPPIPLAKVNGIKRRVFEIRDPGGHAIWFGQAYHPSRARGLE